MIEKPDYANALYPYNQLRPDGSFILRLTNASLLVQPKQGGGVDFPINNHERLILRADQRLTNVSAAATFEPSDWEDWGFVMQNAAGEVGCAASEPRVASSEESVTHRRDSSPSLIAVTHVHAHGRGRGRGHGVAWTWTRTCY